MTSRTNIIDNKPVTTDGTRILFKCFRLLGINMPSKFKIPYIIYSILINLVSLIILPLTFSISFFTDPESLELTNFFTTFQVVVNLHACAIKFMVIAYYRRRLFEQVVEILKGLDARITYPDEIKEIRGAVKFGNRTMVIFLLWYSSFTTAAFLGSLYNGRPLYSLYIPYLDWRDSQLKFAFFSVWEFFLLNIACVQQVSNDAYTIIYIRMFHSHLKALVMRVSRIGFKPGSTPEENLKELRLCISDHKKVIKLINIVSPIMSPTVFLQFMVTATILGSALISIVISQDRPTIISSCLTIGIIVTEILPTCYYVNCLMPEGERLSQAIFHMNWMDQSLEFRRLCLFFMHRSQQDTILYALKILPITINTFVGIIKFSFSLYTLLTTMGFGERHNDQ